MYVDEEGLLKNLPPNEAATAFCSNYVVRVNRVWHPLGTVVLAQIDDEDENVEMDVEGIRRELENSEVGRDWLPAFDLARTNFEWNKVKEAYIKSYEED